MTMIATTTTRPTTNTRRRAPNLARLAELARKLDAENRRTEDGTLFDPSGRRSKAEAALLAEMGRTGLRALIANGRLFLDVFGPDDDWGASVVTVDIASVATAP